MTAHVSVWHSAARSETGKVRAHNEDAVLERPVAGLWAVADGMGGHAGGALASRLIVDRLTGLTLEGDLTQRLAQVRQCLQQANRQLFQAATHAGGPTGSTLVALLAAGARAVCLWAGDSRCYLWRGGRLYQLSRDHSHERQLIDRQGLRPQQAARHPDAQALTRAVGASERLVLDSLELETLPGDRFLLCSDGLHRSLKPVDLGTALDLPLATLAIERLFAQALAGPARDNLSAVVIRR
ncbi:serine/threonine-protein phosphatase [Azotobacter chroococcum subsp. isscasi]|uniref:PP2C family protein-serine/threonine phosphatase n=1 Tax=Azotobacter chroococcum TaxID=353 RepID=UPI0010387C3C|nr:PP2C family serine/threonine-protein phosphatase [Azotobacter chroococcum]TBW06738.1 serine/threonine-protein phosphatase [Azotobacter chroococcum subsp. isscasi]